MAETHSIRLHGPWQATLTETVAVDGTPETEQRVKIPSDWRTWLGDGFRGKVIYRRRFGRPTGLTHDQIVWLIVESVDFQGEVRLNDQVLGTLRLGDPPLRVEVGSQLQKSNQLCVEVELPLDVDRGERSSKAGGLIGQVLLEIDETPGSGFAT